MFVDIKTAQDHFLTPHWTRTHHAQLPIFCALRRARRRNRKRDHARDKQGQMCCIAPPPLPHGSVQAAHTERHMGLLNAGPQAGPQGDTHMRSRKCALSAARCMPLRASIRTRAKRRALAIRSSRGGARCHPQICFKCKASGSCPQRVQDLDLRLPPRLTPCGQHHAPAGQQRDACKG